MNVPTNLPLPVWNSSTLCQGLIMRSRLGQSQAQPRGRTPAATRVAATPAPAGPAAIRRVGQVLRRLQQEEDAEATNLEQSQREFGEFVAHVEDVVEEDESPLFSAYLDELGARGVVVMVGLTPVEFDVLWSVVEAEVVFRWTHGRGRRSSTAPKDAFFMMLCVLKHFNSWYKHAADFRLQPAAFERMITKVSRAEHDAIFLLQLTNGLCYRCLGSWSQF